MSYVTGTQHYNLPQTVGTDKRDWSDTNQAFADVDAALYQAVETAGDASTAAASLDAQLNGTGGVVERLSAAENDIDTVEGSVATLQTTVAGHTTSIADVRSDLEDMITAYNEPDATSDHAYSIGDYFIYNDILYKATTAIAVGATIVPNTNCSASNVMNEVSQLNNDLSKTRINGTVSASSSVDITRENYKSYLLCIYRTQIDHKALYIIDDWGRNILVDDASFSVNVSGNTITITNNLVSYVNYTFILLN